MLYIYVLYMQYIHPVKNLWSGRNESSSRKLTSSSAMAERLHEVWYVFDLRQCYSQNYAQNRIFGPPYGVSGEI